MSDITVESLQLEVQAPTTEAAKSIDSLANTLGKLKSATKGLGLNGVSKQLSTLNSALNGVSDANAAKMEKLANGMKALSTCGKLKLSPTVATQITSIGNAAQSLNGTDFTALNSLATALTPLSSVGKSNLNSFISHLQRLPQAVQALGSVNIGNLGGQITQLVSALTPLSNMGKNNLTSFITQLQKLPQVMSALQSVNMSTLATQIQQLANALAPLATQMQSIANGFSAFPARIQRLIASTNSLSYANNRASLSYVNFAAKVGIAYAAMRRIGSAIASWIHNASHSIEVMNQFTVSMGEYAKSAYNYAQQVYSIMGIDPTEWLENQAVFMTLAKGFGVASDRAYTMSQNLTQLGYDLTSFFDLEGGFSEGMQKLQSAFSGELEPVRRLGYDLSVARLQQEAYTLGITKSVNAMTQAEKAELRYYTLMKQVSWVQGDMARTLESPTNQLRVFKAQINLVARELGNLFIPILNTVLPYLIAFAKVVRDLVSSIAGFFGIKMADSVDWEATTGSLGGVTDGIEDATSAAKKLKNAMLGIDELNIISPTEDSGSGLGTDVGGAGGLGFELPTYDFLGDAVNSKVEAILKKMKDWLGITDEIDTWGEFFHTRLGRILTTVGAIGLGLAAWKISQGVLTGVQGLMALKKAGLDKPLTVSIGVSLAITGIALEASGIIDAIKNELNGMNFAQIIGGGGLITAGGAVIGKAFGAALLGGGIGAVVAGIPAFITGIYDSIKNGIDWLSAALTAIGGAAAGAGVGAICAAAGTAITPGIGTLIGLAVGLVVDGIILIVQKWDVISEFLKKFFTKTVPGLWNDFTTWLGKVPKELGKFFKALPGKIEDWFDDLWQPIKDYDWNGLGYDIGQWFGNAWQTAVNFVTVTIPTWFKNMWESVKSAFKQFFTVTLPTFFTQTIPNVVAKIGDFFKALPGHIYNAFMTAKKSIVDIGSAIIDGIWEGLQSIWQAIKDFVSGFVQGFKDALGIHSPSTVFKAIGEDIVAGLLQGIEGFTNMMNTVKEWAGSVVEWFVDGKDGKNIIDHFKEIGSNIVSGFKENVRNTYSSVKSAISTWANGVKEWFTGSVNGNTFANYASQIISGFKTKISSTYESVKSSITTWASKVKDWFTNSSFGGVNATKFGTYATDVLDGFRNKISTTYTSVKSSITTWASNVKTWFSSTATSGAFAGYANDLLNGFKNKIGSAYTNTKSSITTWASNVKSWFSGTASSSAFAGLANDIINGFKNKIGSAYTNAKSNMQTFGSSVKSWFTGYASYNSFYNVASDVVSGFKNGIGNLYSTCKNTIKNWGADIIEWFKSKLGINSPSKVFYEMAGFSIEGFNRGFTSMGNTTKRVVSGWADSFTAVTPTMAFAVDTSALDYYQGHDYTASAHEYITANHTVCVDHTFAKEELRAAMLEALNESNMAHDMRRQADKEEQTIVQLGTRTVNDAVVRQQNANGYRFSTAY